MKACPYCHAKDNFTFWLKTKSKQTDLRGRKDAIELKLKLPKCKTCGNIMRYYINEYGETKYFNNPKGL